MKALLYKQLRLVCHPMTPVFCLFGIMVIIPNYPYTVIVFYVTLGLFFSFLNMREQKDLDIPLHIHHNSYILTENIQLLDFRRTKLSEVHKLFVNHRF